MKFIDEYRQADLARKLADEIASMTSRPLKLMEVCGGHTHTIFKYGIEDLLPPNIEMIHGPGCPVCVIPLGRVDDSISIALKPGVIFTTFGDMMRVPGSKTSLLDAKASGADARMVYSPLDALKIAKKNPGRHVVFLALGFETTAPSTALTILQAAKDKVGNFSVLHQDLRRQDPGERRSARRVRDTRARSALRSERRKADRNRRERSRRFASRADAREPAWPGCLRDWRSDRGARGYRLDADQLWRDSHCGHVGGRATAKDLLKPPQFGRRNS